MNTHATSETSWARARSAFRAQYLELDTRLLAAFRIYFGLVLLADILRRFPVLTLFYTDDGVLPSHFAIFAPMSRPLVSLFFAFSTTGEVFVAFTLTALVYVGLIVGYRTKLMQILTAILFPSLMARNLFFEMGGSWCISLAATWTLFLPLGDRFSLDALRKSLSRRHEQTAAALNDRALLRPSRAPHVSLVALGLLLQITAIYFLNCVQKTGSDWRTGQAVHWVLWQNRIATALCGWFRLHEPGWFSPLLTWGTLVVEGGAPLMLLAPYVWKWTRSIFVVLAVAFHVGIALFADVGPYSYIMLAFDLLLVPGFWFDRAARWLREGKVARVVAYDPTDAGLHWLARLLARMDTFELLRFIDRNDASQADELKGLPPSKLATRRPDGSWALHGEALVEAVEVLPLGAVLTRFPFRGRIVFLFRVRPLIVWATEIPPGRSDPRSIADEAVVWAHARLSRLGVWTRESLVALFAFVAFMQVLHDNSWINSRVPGWLAEGPPGPLFDVPTYLRQYQHWQMFAEAPRDDATVIVDAVTADGRHIDPFTGQPPDFNVMFHGPLRYGQLFCDYLSKIAGEDFRGYRPFLARYLENWQALEGRPENDRIVSYRVLWVGSMSPRFGETAPTNVRTSVILEGPPQ